MWSATLIQEIRVGRTSHHNIAISEAQDLNLADQLGIPGVNLNPFTSGPSTIDVSGYTSYLLGFETSLPWDRAERTWTAATTATKLFGNHTLKVGGDVRVNRFMLDQVTHPRGSFMFRSALRRQFPLTARRKMDTRMHWRPSCSMCRTTVDSWSAVRAMLSTAGRAASRRPPSQRLHLRPRQMAADRTSPWTLASGTRTTLPWSDSTRGGMSSYDPETNTLRVAGYGAFPENLGVESYWFNFNPRTGISWRVNDSNVVRAGYGVSAGGRPSQAGQLYPITQSQNIVGPNSFAAAGSLPNGNTGSLPGADSGERNPASYRAVAVAELERIAAGGAA